MTVTVSAGGGLFPSYTVGSPAAATVEIADSDSSRTGEAHSTGTPVASVALAGDGLVEEGFSEVVFEVSLSAHPAAGLAVGFSMSGSSSVSRCTAGPDPARPGVDVCAGKDYVLLVDGGVLAVDSVSFAAFGAGSQGDVPAPVRVTLKALSDSVPEVFELVSLRLEAGSGYSVFGGRTVVCGHFRCGFAAGRVGGAA